MIDFDINSVGLNQVLNTNQTANLSWDLKAFRNEKSVSYENRYAEIYFEHKDGVSRGLAAQLVEHAGERA